MKEKDLLSILTSGDEEDMRESSARTCAVLIVVHEDEESTEVPISADDTFEQVKKRILQDRYDLQGSQHWAIIFAFISSVRVRPMFQPAQGARLLSTVQHEEQSFPGQVILHLTFFGASSALFSYSTKGRVRSASSKMSETGKNLRMCKSVEHITFDDHYPSSPVRGVGALLDEGGASISSTVPVADTALMMGSLPKQESVSQLVLWEIMEGSIKHGQLIRKSHGEEELWYAMLDSTRLWFYVLGGSNAVLALHPLRKHPELVLLSYIEIPADALLSDKGASSHTFFLTKLGDTFMPGHNDSLHFKGRDLCDKEDWMAAFECRHLHPFSGLENETFHEAESVISNHQYIQSTRDADLLAKYSSFEGMMCNSMLRDRFKSYLRDNFINESFMFWEQVEDYRRGSEMSTDAFPFYGGLPYSPSDTQRWALTIYETFLRIDAPLRIAEISGETAAQILSKLDETKVGLSDGRTFPPVNIFEALQRLCYQKLKFSEGHYINFVSQPKYRNLLMASVHFQERHLAGLRSLATTLSDNRLLPSEMGYVGEDVDGCFVTTAVTESRGFLSRAFGWGKSRMENNDGSTDGTASGASQAQQTLLMRNVSWRKEKSMRQYLPNWWWTYIKIDPPVEDCEEQRPFCISSAGLSVTYEKGLVLELEGAIQKANSLSTKKAGLNFGKIEVLAGNSRVGHTTLNRIHFVDRCTSRMYCNEQSGRSGVYGTVLLAGMIHCHHITEIAQDDRSFFRSATFSSLSNRRMSYVPASPLSDSSSPMGFSNSSININNSTLDLSRTQFDRLYAVVSYFRGHGRLFFYDESSNRLLSRLRLELITGIAVSTRVLNGVELYEGLGRLKHCSVVFVVQCVSQEESSSVTQRWIDHLHPFCHPECSMSRVAYSGQLSKRGMTNSAWQPRYFILTSTPSLTYYKTTTGWQSEEVLGNTYKGNIDLNGLRSDAVRVTYANPSELSIQTTDRLFHLLASDAEEASIWYTRITEVLDAYGRESSAPSDYPRTCNSGIEDEAAESSHVSMSADDTDTAGAYKNSTPEAELVSHLDLTVTDTQTRDDSVKVADAQSSLLEGEEDIGIDDVESEIDGEDEDVYEGTHHGDDDQFEDLIPIEDFSDRMSFHVTSSSFTGTNNVNKT